MWAGMTSQDTSLVAVNFHLYKPCNYRCRFCFATFRDIRGQLDLEQSLRLLRLLRDAGCEKLNFAGGEPTLHPHIGALLAESRRLGLVTSIISNGARLSQLLAAHAADLDWVGLSVDSADESVQSALGRGTGGHVARSLVLADEIRARGLRLKLNSVVTALNWREDMSAFIRRVRPERWKVFQVLPVGGQNDGAVDDLLIDAGQFRAFVDRHAGLAAEGLAPIAEDNDAMTASYAMIDPLGRLFDNSAGRHTYSAPITEVGVERALRQIRFSLARLVARGGKYAW
jgi:radical S-adenosyl methionine domain-containing protein 2